MGWLPGALNWLIHAALGSFLFLAAGSLAVLLCRQPVRRVRLIELSVLGTLLVPLVVLLPGLPRWSAGWLDLAPLPAPAAVPEPADALAALSRPRPETAPSSELLATGTTPAAASAP